MTTPSRNDSPPPVALPVFAAPPGPTPAPGNYGPGQPRPRTEDSEAPSHPTLEMEEPRRQSLASRLGFGSQKPAAPDDTPSGTSSPEPGGKRALANAGDAAILFSGLLVAVAAGAAWIIQLRSAGQLTLRTPSEEQRKHIAAPLARIAARHVSADLLNADLADIIHGLAATGAYVTAGPIIKPTVNAEENPS